MKTKLLLILLTLLGLFACQNESKPSLVFVGDAMLGRKVGENIEKKGKEIYINAIQNVLKNYTFKILNLECVFTESNNPRDKQFVFKVKPDLAEILHQGGITHVITANNHSLDFGLIGFEENQKHLKNVNIIAINDIQHFSNYPETKIMLSKKEVFIYAISQINDAIADSLVAFNDRFSKLIKTVQEKKASNKNAFIVISLHWGHEYHEKAWEYQRKMAIKLIQAGADALIGHHPHIVQNIEFILNKPVFYSVGNFIFDQNRKNTNKGIAVILTFDEKENPIFRIKPFLIKNTIPTEMNEEESSNFRTEILRISPDIFLEKNNDEWLLKSKIDHFSLSYYNEIDHYPEKINDTIVQISDTFFRGKVHLRRVLKRQLYEISCIDEKTNQENILGLRYPIYRFAVGDIDGDGGTNIFVGTIKSTKFDPIIKKRLFIYQIKNGEIKPLWLGSQLMTPLCDFKVYEENRKFFVKTLEKNYNELYCIRIYDYGTFGLKFIRNVHENLNEKQAKICFDA
jgi:poly-gamma-glutamate synthesis protein (capsule biosynthesis protein)